MLRESFKEGHFLKKKLGKMKGKKLYNIEFLKSKSLPFLYEKKGKQWKRVKSMRKENIFDYVLLSR